jgi:hypothetical protein
LTLSKNMKGLAPFSDQSEIRKMSIEGRHLVDTQASHHSETRAIHDGKILVTPGNAKVQRDLKIRQSNRLDHRYPAPQAFPKSLRSFAVKLVVLTTVDRSLASFCSRPRPAIESSSARADGLSGLKKDRG